MSVAAARKTARIAFLGVASLLLAQSGWTQTTAGSIAGLVRDTTGAVLPGVTVEAASPALIEKVRTGVTDGQGRFNIVDLRPGIYTVTFTLAGFSTVRREGIEISAGFTPTVNAEMRVGAVEETITVTGATPVVDAQNVRTQQVLKYEVLEALPSGARDLTQIRLADPRDDGVDAGQERRRRRPGRDEHRARHPRRPRRRRARQLRRDEHERLLRRRRRAAARVALQHDRRPGNGHRHRRQQRRERDGRREPESDPARGREPVQRAQHPGVLDRRLGLGRGRPTI